MKVLGVFTVGIRLNGTSYAAGLRPGEQDMDTCVSAMLIWFIDGGT